MDLDDFEQPAEAPVRKSRFAPKSKIKKQPAAAVAKSEPSSEPLKEEVKPSVVTVKEEEEVQCQTSAAVEQMDVDVDSSTVAENGGGGGGDVELNDGEETREASTSGAAAAASFNSEEAMEEDVAEEEDYVIAEYDVYYTPPASDYKLYAMQYPLRPSWRPYELEQRCTEVRVRPISAEVEVDLSIEVESDNYDCDSPAADRMKIQTLSSSWSQLEVAGYAVGLLKGKKLYLNPVHAAVQLRPSMEYLHYGDRRKKNANMGVKEEGSAKAPVAGPPRKENKQMVPEVEEPWVQLNYHSSTSDFAQRYLRNMVTEEDNPLQFSMNPYDYLDSLCPAAVINKIKSSGLSRRYLLSLPLDERLKKCLSEGPHVQRFAAIAHLAPGVPVKDIIKTVQEHATLVQGVWVAKSHVRCKQGADILIRDYALSLFSQNPIMKDSELDILGHRKSAARGVIREIAVERTACKDWKFKEPTDESFLKLHPHIAGAEWKAWNVRGTEILGRLKERGPAPKRPVPPVSSNENLIRATSEPPPVSTPVSNETREGLSKVLGKLFLTHKVCSLQTICQGLRDTVVSLSTQPKAGAKTTAAVEAVKRVVEAPQGELQVIISEYAVNVHGLYVLKSSSENPELNPLRNDVIDLFRGREPGAKLKKSEIMEAAKNKPTTNEFQKVINEYCVSKGAAWVLKSGDGVSFNDWQSIFKSAKWL